MTGSTSPGCRVKLSSKAFLETRRCLDVDPVEFLPDGADHTPRPRWLRTVDRILQGFAHKPPLPSFHHMTPLRWQYALPIQEEWPCAEIDLKRKTNF